MEYVFFKKVLLDMWDGEDLLYTWVAHTARENQRIGWTCNFKSIVQQDKLLSWKFYINSWRSFKLANSQSVAFHHIAVLLILYLCTSVTIRDFFFFIQVQFCYNSLVYRVRRMFASKMTDRFSTVSMILVLNWRLVIQYSKKEKGWIFWRYACMKLFNYLQSEAESVWLFSYTC